jgi:hypothetical protein
VRKRKEKKRKEKKRKEKKRKEKKRKEKIKKKLKEKSVFMDRALNPQKCRSLSSGNGTF